MIKIGALKGLKSINAHIDAEEAKYSGNSTKWFKLSDKEAAKVIFLQELDEDAENFSQKNGLGQLNVEHSHPKKYVNKAMCTAAEDGEGQCWACEQHEEDRKAGWKQKSRLYINVLVDNGVDDPFVAVLSQGTSDKSITPSLIEHATEMETITDRWFKVKRNGSGLSTSYVLTSLKEHDLNVEDYDLFDLDKVTVEVPYVKQEAFYNNGVNSAEPENSEVPVSSSVDTDDDEW